MITFLNKKQLGFILEIKAEEARAKMCVAYAHVKKIKNTAYWGFGDKIEDTFPDVMEISLLSEGLNLPTLQAMVNDITDNFLIRPGTKKWILCDYPEKRIKALTEQGKPKKLTIPTALRSLLPDSTIQKIKEEWNKRYADQKAFA